jgi:hypothetical protein
MKNNFILTKLFVTIIVLALASFAQADEQLPSDMNTPCPAGYTKGYSGYSYYCYSNVVKKTVDTVSAPNNSCPVGYQLTYKGYSYYCDLIVCVVRPTKQPYSIPDNDQCPAGYLKSYSGYTSYCNPIDTVAACQH